MKKLAFMLSVAIVMTMVVTSCKKYEDGPMFSLASKKGRVAGVWEIEKAYVVYEGTETDITEDFSSETKSIEFTKEGDVIQTKPNGDMDEGQQWEFGDKKETIVVSDDDGDGDVITFNITRLKSKELWINTNSELLTNDPSESAILYLRLKQ